MIRIGIMGYGNLGRGVELAIPKNPDMTLAGVFTRRGPEGVNLENIPVYHADAAAGMAADIDVMIVCGGSATDLPEQSPKYAEIFNIVDSFDTHAKIPAHFEAVDKAAKSGGKIAVISTGWDPGLFSLNRLYANAVLPDGKDYTFWGKGVSQGHSDAIRRVAGVVDARQYTIPYDVALEAVRAGENPELSTREKHMRECFVAVEEGADTGRIEAEIVSMPDYFADYDTVVHFISLEELRREHSAMPHGGSVIRTGHTGGGSKQLIEYRLNLGSNPEFTGGVLVACARAAYRLNQEGQSGCRTIFDLPPASLSIQSGEELRRTLL